MIRGENSESLPTDLIVEILSRLPEKSFVRFRCVSKLWSSMLLRPYFTELFLTRSSARPPRLLFAVKRSDDWCFLTSPQPHDPYDKSPSSLVVAAEFHMKFPGDELLEFRGHASGLICFCRRTRISKEEKRTVICNPSTGQFASLRLPKGRMTRSVLRPFLGFDPIDKQFKLLSISAHLGVKNEPEQIMTLGTGEDSWRKIHCPLSHFPTDEGICINGVLYYLAAEFSRTFMIVCFDVRSEKFKFIYRDFLNRRDDTKLINYKGKLGVITLSLYGPSDHPGRSLKLCMWLIKDAEKPESKWSKYFSISWDDDASVRKFYASIVGATATGEIVLSRYYAHQFCVFYINPERNTVQSVEIQGLGANHFDSRGKSVHRRVQVFIDYVEDLKFITTKTTSISPPEQKRELTTTSTSSKAHVKQGGPLLCKSG